MLAKISIVMALGGFMLFAHASYANDYLKTQAQALELIAEFANDICGYDLREGGTKDLKVEGEIRTELNALLKKLANIGVSGTAAYQDSSYLNVLQEDLAALIKAQIKCRENVAMQFKGLVNLVPKEARWPGENPVDDTHDGLSITGNWNSLYGPVKFVQSGNTVSGTLYYTAEPLKKIGATAQLKGKIVENTLTFVWWVFADTPENPTGKGVLRLSGDARMLKGHFTDKNYPGSFAPFQLVRDTL